MKNIQKIAKFIAITGVWFAPTISILSIILMLNTTGIAHYLLFFTFIVANIYTILHIESLLSDKDRQHLYKVLIFVGGFILGFSYNSFSQDLKSDFEKFVYEQDGCIDKTPICKEINIQAVAKYNARNLTSFNTLWEIFTHNYTINTYRDYESQLKALKEVHLIEAQENNDLKKLNNELQQELNKKKLIIDSLKQKISLFELKIEELKDERVLSKNNTIIRLKGIYIHCKTNKIIPKQFIEENLEHIHKVSKNVYIYKPDGSYPKEWVIEYAKSTKEYLNNVNWEKVELNSKL